MLIDKCYCQLSNKTQNAFPLFGRDSEVKVFVSAAKDSSSEALFYGIVKKKVRNWDKSKDLDITEFLAYSFASVASLKMLYSWEMKYTNGYGEVIKNLAEMISLDSECTFENNNKGYVYFDHMAVSDVMRFLAYLKGWCLTFKGKTVKFAPCEKPKHSGVTINLQDLPTGTITEE